MGELTEGLKQMKPGKAQDSSGTMAEVLQSGCGALLQQILALFNDVILLG